MVDGSVSEVGSYEELLSHDGAFAQFLKMYIIETADDERGDIEGKYDWIVLWLYVACSKRCRVRVMLLNATFKFFSAISWWSVLLVEEAWVSEENHRPVASVKDVSSTIKIRLTSLDVLLNDATLNDAYAIPWWSVVSLKKITDLSWVTNKCYDKMYLGEARTHKHASNDWH